MMNRGLMLCMVAILVAGLVHDAAAVTCSPMELAPCLAAMSGSGVPSPQCCAKLREQVPCFCQYMRNPMLRPYIDSTNAKKVSSICNVPTPAC